MATLWPPAGHLSKDSPHCDRVLKGTPVPHAPHAPGSWGAGSPGKWGFEDEGPWGGTSPVRGPFTWGRVLQTVPGGASAVVEHEGPVGVAPAARPPINTPRAVRPVRERHWAGGGCDSERRSKRVGSDWRLLPPLCPETLFSGYGGGGKKEPVPGSVPAPVLERPLPAASGTRLGTVWGTARTPPRVPISIATLGAPVIPGNRTEAL